MFYPICLSLKIVYIYWLELVVGTYYIGFQFENSKENSDAFSFWLDCSSIYYSNYLLNH